MAGLLSAVALWGCAATDRSSIDEDNGRNEAGVSAGLMGINVPPGEKDNVAEQVRDLGATWVRLEIVDNEGEATDTLSDAGRARLQSHLDRYKAQGLHVLVVADYSLVPGWSPVCDESGADFWPTWRAQFLSRLLDVARSFGGQIDAWEIWNEPDHPCNGKPYPLHEKLYGPLLWDAAGVLRNDAGVEAPIVMAGMESGQVSYVKAAIEASGVPASSLADAVSFHPYGVVPEPSWCGTADEPADPGEDLYCAFGSVSAKIDEYSDAAEGLPVWITEAGIVTGDEKHFADYLEGVYTVASRSPKVQRVLWYAFANSPSEGPFGVFTVTGYDGDGVPQYEPKQTVYERYKSLATGCGCD